VALYTEVAEHSEFSTSEVRSLFREFRAIANQGKLNRQQFRDAIGILGTFRDSVIPDRLFDAFDLDRDGMIDASEYVAGMSVMTRGSDAEKLALSWRMADLDNSGSVTVEEVHIIMESYHRVLASLGLRTGVGTCIWRSDVAQLFTELENGDEIAKDAYARAMSGLDVVEWLRAHERYGPDEGTPEGQAAAQAAAAAADTRGRRVTYVLDGEERASLRAAPEAAEEEEEEETGEVTEDELMAMSVKALKTMFAKRKVSLTGCFEKTDMRAKARSAGLVIAEPEEPPAAEDEDEESKDGGAAAAAAGGGGGGGGGGGDPINGGLSDEEEEGGVGGGGDESEEGKVAALSLEETLRKLQEGVMECLGVADALTAQLKDKQAAADAEELAALAAEAVQAEQDGAAAAAAAAAPADDAAAAGDSAEAAATRPAAESAAAAAVVASAVGVEANGFSSLDDAKESVASMEAKLATLLTLIARADTIVAEGGVPAQPATTEASLAGLEATAAPAPPLLKSFTKVQLAVPRASTVGTTPATRNKHIGDPVGFIHRSWDLVMNVMLGVRLAVGRVASDAGREITPTDFKQHDRYTLSASAGAQSDAVSAMKTATNSKQMKAKGKELPPYVFIDHCPQVFHQLRLMLGIDTDEYMKSVGPESLLSNLFTGSLSSLSELVSEGKSGSFFYFTHDGRYMVKTLREGEKHALAEILPDYFYHMQRNPDSMLTRFLGMHELHKRDMNKPKEAPQKYYFVVMQVRGRRAMRARSLACWFP
jgi:Ca2+-binding EF-hand superfamily protein